MRPASVLLVAFAAASCARSRSADDGGVAREAEAASMVDAAVEEDAAPPEPILGEWERRTEPYEGMRIAIRSGTPMRAVVTMAPPVTPERLASYARGTPAAVAKAQLECQRSVWRTGEELVTGIRPAGDAAFEASILVRDWGYTGTCRHADSHAPARLSVSAEGELSIAVTRGKTVVQRWSRVGR